MDRSKFDDLRPQIQRGVQWAAARSLNHAAVAALRLGLPFGRSLRLIAYDRITGAAGVIVGRRAEDFATVRFSNGTEKVLESALTGRRFSWPPNVPALADGGVYELALLRKGSVAQPLKMSFRAVVRSEQHQQQVLIRVD